MRLPENVNTALKTVCEKHTMCDGCPFLIYKPNCDVMIAYDLGKLEGELKAIDKCTAELRKINERFEHKNGNS